MNKLFTENLPWKIASLVMATMLWLFVINTQNPTQPQEISGIKIQINGEDILKENGYELTNRDEIKNQNFKVVVSGPRLEVDKLLRNPTSITATLNLAEYEDDLTRDSISDTNVNYSVRINGDSTNVVIKDKKPQVTKVLIDKIASKEQKVTYEIAEDITSSYTLLGDGKPIISPEKVMITGAKSEIDKVAEAKVVIKAEDFSAEQLVNDLPIKLFDVDGNAITGLNLSTDTAEVKLPIGSEKIVPIKVNYTGEIPEGYILTKVDTAVNNVTIVGKAEVLAGINQIDLMPIDLSKITESKLLQVKMVLPDGVVSLEEDSVSVSLHVSEENTLNYPILMSELNLTVEGLAEGLTYEILTTSVNVELSGLSDDLILTEKSDIKATLDLTNYLEGEYTLPLTIVAPDNIKVTNNPINIKVRIKALEETTPSPSPGEDEVADGSSSNGTTDEDETNQGENEKLT